MPRINWGNLGREALDTANPFNGDTDYDLSPDVSVNGGARNATGGAYGFGGQGKTQPGWQNGKYVGTGSTGVVNSSNNVNQQTSADNSGVYGGAAGGGTGKSAQDIQADLAYIAEQEGILRNLLGRSGTLLNQGLTQIGDDFNKRTGRANEDRSRANQRFTDQFTDTAENKDSTLNRVNMNSRMLANSLRQKIGQASGSGSSAYQITAPGAVARQQSMERDDTMGTYADNFRDIGRAQEETESDFERLLRDLAESRQSAEKGLREGILSQEQGVQGQLADLARQRATVQGGNYDDIRAAGAPFQAQVQQRQSAIDNLFNQFRTPYGNVKGVSVKAPTLRDYAVDRTNIGQQQAQTQPNGTQAPFKPFGEEEEEQLY